jgi:AcrR family transcriptional regulator
VTRRPGRVSSEVARVNETSRDRQREATRQRLYEAALGIFRRDGFRDARVDDITLVAGVSRTAFYFHFPTKEDVLTELMRRTEQPIADAVAMMPPQAELSAVLETVAELMNRAWQDERALIVDAMAIGMRIESSAFPKSPNGLRALLLHRFEAASKAGQLVETQKACLLVDLYLLNCMAAMAAWAQDVDRSLLDSLRTANRLFLDGARRAFKS